MMLGLADVRVHGEFRSGRYVGDFYALCKSMDVVSGYFSGFLKAPRS